MRFIPSFSTGRGLRMALFSATVGVTLLAPRPGAAQLLQNGWNGYARNAQHTAQAPAAAQPINRIRWSTPVDQAPQYTGNDLFIHYGSPIITARNTVIV